MVLLRTIHGNDSPFANFVLWVRTYMSSCQGVTNGTHVSWIVLHRPEMGGSQRHTPSEVRANFRFRKLPEVFPKQESGKWVLPLREVSNIFFSACWKPRPFLNCRGRFMLQIQASHNLQILFRTCLMLSYGNIIFLDHTITFVNLIRLASSGTHHDIQFW